MDTFIKHDVYFLDSKIPEEVVHPNLEIKENVKQNEEGTSQSPPVEEIFKEISKVRPITKWKRKAQTQQTILNQIASNTVPPLEDATTVVILKSSF